jgi:hypothetical protein
MEKQRRVKDRKGTQHHQALAGNLPVDLMGAYPWRRGAHEFLTVNFGNSWLNGLP